MQTVNEAIDPESVRAGLDGLRDGISRITAAERELIKGKAARLAATHRDSRQQGETETARLDARIHTIHEDFKERSEELRARSDARAAWAQQAYHASKASLARRIEERKDRRIGRVQGDIMRRRQDRQQDIEIATAGHQAFQKTLGEDRGRRRKIRARIMSTFRTFRPLIAPWFEGRRGAVNEVKTRETPERTRSALGEIVASAAQAAEAGQRLPLVRFFRFVPLTLLLVLVAGIHLWLGMRAGGGGVLSVLPSLAISTGVLFVLWMLALVSSLPVLKRAARELATARALEQAAAKQSAARLANLEENFKLEEQEEGRNLSETFQKTGQEWRSELAEGQRALDERFARVPGRIGKLHQRRLAELETQRDAAIARECEEKEGRMRRFEAEQSDVKDVIAREAATDLASLAEQWRGEVTPRVDDLIGRENASLASFPGWTAKTCESWEPPAEAPPAVRLGHIEVDAEMLAGGLPGGDAFPLTPDGRIEVPFALGFPYHGSLVVETDGPDDGTAARVLQAAALRILASHPPGRAGFLFIDPVGLGRDFAGLMHLSDYEETLITSRIWTQNTHIEERLAEIMEHIEKVIQMYLRDEFPDINAYNSQAETIAEKYRFLVIAGFPASFSDTAAKRLRSVVASGARCGVHVLMQRDTTQNSPDPALDEELRRIPLRLALKAGAFRLLGAPAGADGVTFDRPPSMQDSITLVHRIGRASVDSNRVEVPFAQIAPPAGAEWSLDTAEELVVPIGRTGARKLQTLAIGKGTRQHMLVAGKTGSGKSTLFHVIITNLGRWGSPDQVEFYLVDFKKGVEFKCYATKRLPHARVVAIESDREFALSVLQRVDAELKRRGELFRKAEVQDLAGYRRSPGAGPLPRTLLLIDEFQEFFTEDDGVAQEASLLLDRIVRQGRAFGIHVILGSQTLGGAYTLARATLGQMVIRVALQCNEADAHLIMDDDNPAPRLLTRPGEGIYNDQAGALAANSPFQIVWLPEDERDAVLDEISARARATDGEETRVPIVFEGNAPAEVRDNPELAAMIRERPAGRPRRGRAWLGAPNSIKGPTEAVFQRQSGSHLLVVGQSTERSLALLGISLASLALQYPPGDAEFVVLDPHAEEPDAPDIFRHLAEVFPGRIRIGGPADVAALLGGLGTGLAARAPSSGRDAPEVFLIVSELQRFKALRPEDDFRFSLDDDASGAASPSQTFAELLGEGGPCGMHVITSTDTWNNVSRWIPRKLLAEFEMRVLFQMSANDSANLIDSPAASTLGLHRALFHNEHLGTLETFRPYALPDEAWFDELS